MRIFPTYVTAFILTLVVATTIYAPLAEAKTHKRSAHRKSSRYAYDLYNPHRHYGDEKVDIKDASSRCNTAVMRRLHTQNLERAKEDGKMLGLTFESVSTTEPLLGKADLYKKYLTGLDFAWGAMEEPYCGFGAFGTAAARKSYDKSVARIRARFLEGVNVQKRHDSKEDSSND